MAGMGMALQLGMMQAQKKVLESQANLNNVEATKKAGVDTQEAESRISQIMATTDNERLKGDLMKVETSEGNGPVRKAGNAGR